MVFEEAIKEPKWKNAMDEEITSIEKNNTWELVDNPQRQKRKPKSNVSALALYGFLASPYLVLLEWRHIL